VPEVLSKDFRKEIMMHTRLILKGLTLLAGMTWFVASEDDTPRQSGLPEKTAAGEERSEESQEAERSKSDLYKADEKAIRDAGLAFAKAYQDGDTPAVVKCFTVDAEYVDEIGSVFDGREAIEASLVECFARHPKCKLEMDVESIRFISPNVAIEDGSTQMTGIDTATSVDSRYSTLHVKTDGKWLIASVRNHAPRDRREHQANLQQLDWLIGDWVDENDDAIVHFACEAADQGNFLVRTFSIHVAGLDAMTGTQRIGWDPLTGKLRTWIFDSEGAFGDGFWSRRVNEDGAESWLLKTTGVTADGQTASSTSIYTAVNDHTMTWQSVDHEIGGEQLPDSEIMTIVRSAPAPGQKLADGSN
jgi:uncharacterized protein (TIGR02246 family)